MTEHVTTAAAHRQHARGGRIVVGALTAEIPAAGGIQRFSTELLRELLALDSRLLALAASPRVAEVYAPRVKAVRPEVMARGNFAGNLLRLGWHQTVLPSLLRREEAAVFYSTVPDGMLAPPCPQVVTVHDLIPLIHPESGPRLKHYFRHVVPRVIEASAAVIAMSEATKRDLERLLRVPGERVHVVHQGYRAEVFHPVEGTEVERVRAAFSLERYLLTTADGRSYKNIPRVLQAFARLRPAGVQLALIGRTSRREVDLRALAASLGLGDRVRFLGFVSDDDLAALYAGAEAFVFPSLYEGFGIPPLEAMACGCPVVCSHRASMPEVCGDVAVYVDPYAVEAIAEGLRQVLEDSALRESLRSKGPGRAAGFSYRAAAERVLAVLRGCAAGGANGRVDGDGD